MPLQLKLRLIYHETGQDAHATSMPTRTSEIETLANREYKWGFITDIEADAARRD